MTKGDDTRQMIVQHAAELFNLQGYFGTSMSDVMRATGLEKGGLYNHFKSKDELALAAFDYAVSLIRQALRDAVRGRLDAIERLHAVFAIYRDIGAGRVLAGGCPVANTAHEADHTHPALRERAELAMQEWLAFFRWILIRGQRQMQIKPDIDTDSVATFVIATLEGAVMLTQLYDDTMYMDHALTQLEDYTEFLRQ